MKKLQVLIGPLITILFLIPMAHSQGEIYIAQGISITDCSEFTHGYGLSLSPGRMDNGHALEFFVYLQTDNHISSTYLEYLLGGEDRLRPTIYMF